MNKGKTDGTYQSDTPGTFQTVTDGTFHSAMTGTFQSDTGGTSIPMLSYYAIFQSHGRSRVFNVNHFCLIDKCLISQLFTEFFHKFIFLITIPISGWNLNNFGECFYHLREIGERVVLFFKEEKQIVF
mgnify:FL=1